jgi:hypothetical protein
MKNSALFIASSIALTTILYLLTYFFLPPPPPDASIVSLFAVVSVCFIFVLRAIVRKVREKKKSRAGQKLVILIVALGSLAALMGCPGTRPVPPPQTAPALNGHGPDVAPSEGRVGAEAAGIAAVAAAASLTSRSTGYELLPSYTKEGVGYGLYSYALLSHKPSDNEKPAYRAFIRAFLGLPTASGLGKYLPRFKINITYIPQIVAFKDSETTPVEKQVDLVLDRYDYARAVALLSRFPNSPNAGPTITSVLKPLSEDADPHPVLFQDLSMAQPDLMEAYVSEFVRQAAQRDFSKARALPSFELKLRNLLEVTANGLGLSNDAVKSWISLNK